MSVVTGQTAVLQVTPSISTTLTYQWRFNGRAIRDANGSVYSIPATSVYDNGAYDVIVSNGSTSSVSNPATLSVAPTRYPEKVGIDPAFAPMIETGEAFIMVVVRQGDGKLLVGGEFTGINGVARRNLARLLPDGTVDLSFDPGAGPNAAVRAIAVQGDGRLIIGGSFSLYDTNGASRIARVNVDGSFDSGFSSGSGANGDVFALALFEDGKVLLAGAFNTVNGFRRNYVARLLATGSLDSSFDAGTSASAPILAAVALPLGQALVGGSFVRFNDVVRNGLARLSADGSLDNSFAVGLPADTDVSAVVRQPDGKVVVGASSFGAAAPRLFRLNDSGTLDPTFNVGTGPSAAVYSLDIQSDRRILVGGLFTSFNGTARSRIVRLNPDGAIDPTFVPPGSTDSEVRAIARQSAGRVVVGGRFRVIDTTAKSGLARLAPDGALDATFLAQVRTGGKLWTAARQPDGKLIIGGRFTHVNGSPRDSIARLLPDGSLDTTFNASVQLLHGVTGAAGEVDSVALQPDGKILVGGGFDTVNGVSRQRIARLNADGTLDTTFNPGTGADTSVVTSVALTPEDKVMIGGGFTSFNGIARKRVARLNANGTLDFSFDPGVGPTGVFGLVQRVVPQGDGRTLIGGWFAGYAGTATSGVARLLPSGAIDPTFNAGTTFGESGAFTILPAPDGRIYVGGGFSSGGATTPTTVGRLTSSGGMDSLFNRVDYSLTGTVGTLMLQPDGKVLAAQSVTVGGSTQSLIGLARYDATGKLDRTFDVPGLVDAKAGQIILQDDGSLLIAGDRFYTGTMDRSGLALLNHYSAPAIVSPASTTFVVGRPNSYKISASGIPAAGYSIEANNPIPWLRLHPTTGLLTGTPPVGTTAPLMFSIRASSSMGSSVQVFDLSFDTPPSITTQPEPVQTTIDGTVTLRVVAQGSPALTFQWRKDGMNIAGATASSFVVPHLQMADIAAYSVVVTNRAGTVVSDAAAVSLNSTEKVTGTGIEVGPDTPHPSGNIYDQLLLTGARAVATADPSQVTRISFIDLSNDIVQVEFSGTGTLSVALAGATGPAAPLNYNQDVNYMKGHASIVVTGADETTNLSVFSVGKVTAVNQGLFRTGVSYDGFADLASISIASRNGKFGGLRAANASFFATQGITGVIAPGVQFTGPVYIGDIAAAGDATPMLILGASGTTQINGGDLLQANGRAVQVKGFDALQFVAGTTSHGVALPARANRAALERDGVDVTDSVVVNP